MRLGLLNIVTAKVEQIGWIVSRRIAQVTVSQSLLCHCASVFKRIDDNMPILR